MKIYDASAKKVECELHNCVRGVMRICRWFGFMPVEGLGSLSIKELRFNNRSFYRIYNLITIIGQATLCGVSLIALVRNNLSIKSGSLFVFHASNFLSAMFLFKLASKYPHFVNKISKMESSVDGIRMSGNFPRICKVITYLTLLCGFTEHVFFIVNYLSLSMICRGVSKVTFEVVADFFKERSKYLLSYETGFYLEYINIQSTFLWSFTDIIIMCMAIHLASYFQNFNRIINHQKSKDTYVSSEMSEKNANWTQLRLHYSQIVGMVKEVDYQMKPQVLLSLSSNLYFICCQLYNTIKQNAISRCDDGKQKAAAFGIPAAVYYTFSFFFLLGRTLLLSVLAANVHIEARESINSLSEVPDSKYNIEVQRFFRQIKYTTTGISGIFFYITRILILKLVGTFVTYELVLLQFAPEGPTKYTEN